MSVLATRNLTRHLHDGEVEFTLVEDVSVSFAEGEFAVITGPSGSGKSSLLYLLGLLDVPTSGDVLLDGESTARLPEDARAALRLRHFGFVFQFHFLLPELTVLDNVMLPMRQLARLDEAAMRSAARGVLAGLGMEDQARKLPSQLSGGQRQRVAVARALANQPRFILADEPTGSLDSRNSAAVFAMLQDLSRRGHTVIVVTHDADFAVRAGRRIKLVDGRQKPEVRIQKSEI